ncbi:hypothetical protein [Devosia submarina]|uniref:hypothetical protein n=1 Tax=Devosia submarina TaxID=1173082 RepID=UPI000D3742BB|nr:hypothetical protein [Devosia submarina]
MDAIGQLLGKLADLFIDQGFNALFSGFGGGGGLFAGIGKLFGLPSFAGGGFTGTGARAGGLDGQGGFLAMMHPNETLLDHSANRANGGNTVVMNQNISLAGAMSLNDVGAIAKQFADNSVREVRKALPGWNLDMQRRMG